MTPHYTDDAATLWHGDALDVLRELPDASVDAVVCDPPYNLSFMAKPWDAYEGREDAGFAYWLSGLIDGEGHFGIKAHARGTHAPHFALKLRADERGTLEQIRRSLGVGTISDEKREPNPMVKYVIQDKAGCQRLVDLLDKYPLRAKKQQDYWVWREAVCEWTSRPRGNRWHGRADNTRMAGLRDRLMEGRAYTDIPWSGHEFQDWCRLWAAECLRVLKPGGHMLAFGGTRTFHRLACAVEDAGFEVRDSIAWLYGSGFPKSLDVSKAIDKAARGVPQGGVDPTSPNHGRYRTTTTEGKRWDGDSGQGYGAGGSRFLVDGKASGSVTEPAASGAVAAAPEAEQWQGWGTALKSAFEPIVVARKPLAGTVAANVLAHGTGALNIDGCRIEGAPDPASWRVQRTAVDTADGRLGQKAANIEAMNAGLIEPPTGRWPANVVLDESMAEVLDEQSGETVSKSGGTTTRLGTGGIMNPAPPGTPDRTGHDDSGGASRFFYVAKADASERVRVNGTAHPTVKPLALMRWLVRLVTPPGGVVLEPFAGSGTTVEACLLEGFHCIAVEREADYLPLIVQRINRRRDPVAAVKASGDDGGLFDLFGEGA